MSKRAVWCVALSVCVLAARGEAEVLKTPSATYPTIAAAVAAAQNGDVVEIQPGTYTQPLILSNVIGVTVRGKGKVVIDATGIASGIAVFTCVNVKVENVEVRSATANGVEVGLSSRVALKKVRSIGSGAHGFAVQLAFASSLSQCTAKDSGDNGFALVLSQSYVRQCQSIDAGKVGIEIDGDSNVVVACKVVNPANEGIWIHDSGSDCDANVIRDNVVLGAGTIGIFASGDGLGNALTRNRVKGSGGYGIEITLHGTVVNDNRVEGTALDGFWIGAQRCTVQGNKVKQASANGFFLQTATDDSTFFGNSVQGAGSAGFRVAANPVTFGKNKAKGCASGPIVVEAGGVVLGFENGFDVP